MTETSPHDADQPSGQPRPGVRTAWNWALALLTLPAAGAVYLLAMAGVMGLAGCTGGACADRVPNEFWFGVLVYGAPVIAVVCVAVSVVTARLRRGILVPLTRLGLLALDAAVLVTAFDF